LGDRDSDVLEARSRFARARSGRAFIRQESQLLLIYEAPAPRLPRLDRAHDRVGGGVKVRGGVLVRRRVTAPDVSADHADAEMHPPVADAQTVLAAARARMYASDLPEVLAAGAR